MALFTARPISSEGGSVLRKKKRSPVKERVLVEAVCLRLLCVEIRIHVVCSQVCVCVCCAAVSRSTSSLGEFTFVCVSLRHTVRLQAFRC